MLSSFSITSSFWHRFSNYSLNPSLHLIILFIPGSQRKLKMLVQQIIRESTIKFCFSFASELACHLLSTLVSEQKLRQLLQRDGFLDPFENCTQKLCWCLTGTFPGPHFPKQKQPGSGREGELPARVAFMLEGSALLICTPEIESFPPWKWGGCISLPGSPDEFLTTSI